MRQKVTRKTIGHYVEYTFETERAARHDYESACDTVRKVFAMDPVKVVKIEGAVLRVPNWLNFKPTGYEPK